MAGQNKLAELDRNIGMIINRKKKSDVLPSEITSHSSYLNRRQFLGQTAALSIAATALPAQAIQTHESTRKQRPEWLAKQVAAAKETKWGKGESLTPYSNVTQYNNFYEFGTGKDDPYKYAS